MSIQVNNPPQQRNQTAQEQFSPGIFRKQCLHCPSAQCNKQKDLEQCLSVIQSDSLGKQKRNEKHIETKLRYFYLISL